MNPAVFCLCSRPVIKRSQSPPLQLRTQQFFCLENIRQVMESWPNCSVDRGYSNRIPVLQGCFRYFIHTYIKLLDIVHRKNDLF